MLVKFDQKDKNASKILGGINIEPLPIILGWSYGLVVIFTYYVGAILTDEIKPFPHCTITGSATPYPQNIVFRFIILPQLGTVLFLYIGIYYIFKFANKEVRKIDRNFNLSGIWDYCCNLKFFVILTLISWVFIGIAVATIDSYYMNDTLHGASAVIGFVGLFITAVMMVNFFKRLLPYNPDIISETSLKWKQAIVNFQFAVLIYVIQHQFCILNSDIKYTDWETSILEYSVFYSLVFFFYSFRYDFQGYYFFWGIQQAEKNDVKIVASVPLIQREQFYTQIPVNQTTEQQPQQVQLSQQQQCYVATTATPVYFQPQQQQVVGSYQYPNQPVVQQPIYQAPIQKAQVVEKKVEKTTMKQQDIELVEQRSVYPTI